MDELTLKAIKGFLNLAIIFGLLLFLPAWTLTYWQGWVFWPSFMGSCLWITLYFLKHDRNLIERRLQAGPTAETEKSQKIIQSVASILVVSILLFSVLDYRFGWSHVPPIGSIIADGVVLAGFYIVFRVFQENSFTAATIVVEKDQTVIKTGPYAIVRHPMYTGALLLFLATPIVLGSYWGLILSLFLIVTLAFRAIDEETVLRKNLPGYTDYAAKTPYRLIPFIW